MKQLEQLTIEDFQPLLNQQVVITFFEKVTINAVLAEVTSLGHYANNARQPFSIVLQTQQQKEYYPQAIYTISHPSLGNLSLFLVPLAPNETGTRYEAVFG